MYNPNTEDAMYAAWHAPRFPDVVEVVSLHQLLAQVRSADGTTSVQSADRWMDRQTLCLHRRLLIEATHLVQDRPAGRTTSTRADELDADGVGLVATYCLETTGVWCVWRGLLLCVCLSFAAVIPVSLGCDGARVAADDGECIGMDLFHNPVLPDATLPAYILA